MALITATFVAGGLAWLQPQLLGYYLHDRGEAGPAESEAPAVETHSPPIDPFIVPDAVNQLAYVVSLNGSAAPEGYSRRCFSELYGTPDVRLIDHCIAFDFAAAVQRGAGSSEAQQEDADYFAPPAQNDRHWRALALVDIPKRQAAARLGTLKEKVVRASPEST